MSVCVYLYVYVCVCMCILVCRYMFVYACCVCICVYTYADGKVSARNAEDLGSIPGYGRSRGEGNGNPVQYSCLENSMN